LPEPIGLGANGFIAISSCRLQLAVCKHP
jgi:hypothetical protein